MSLQQSEIYLIEFGPGRGHEFQKVRPGIILMDNQVLQRTNMVTCVPLTSNLKNCGPDDIALNKDTNNMLANDSVVKMHHITCCDKARIGKYIGKVGSGDWSKIAAGLKLIFGI
jgi:mRNA-degrading endonuclease toxin of MazEF toxin-antitoxin module